MNDSCCCVNITIKIKQHSVLLTKSNWTSSFTQGSCTVHCSIPRTVAPDSATVVDLYRRRWGEGGHHSFKNHPRQGNSRMLFSSYTDCVKLYTLSASSARDSSSERRSSFSSGSAFANSCLTLGRVSMAMAAPFLINHGWCLESVSS